MIQSIHPYSLTQPKRQITERHPQQKAQVMHFKGKCNIEKCKAICCYHVPIPEDYLKKFADKIVNEVIFTKKLPKGTYKGKHVLPITNVLSEYENKCPFLTITNKCAIYENRPPLCKEFGTLRKPGLICPRQEK